MAQAETSLFPSTRMFLAVTQYAGSKSTSLGETGNGFSGEIEVETDGFYVAPFAKARATYISGQQNFLDGSTETSLPFVFEQGSFEVGVHIYPIRRRKDGFNIYLGAAGGISYQIIQIDSTTTTSLPQSDQSMSTNYGGIVGAELLLSSKSSRRWALVGELTQRTESTKLLGQTGFDLRNVTLSIGLGW